MLLLTLDTGPRQGLEDAMRNLLARSFMVVAFAFATAAGAQMPSSRLEAAAALAGDLVFPREASQISFFTSPGMALYKPEGAGPFPALILLHACSGLKSGIRNYSNTAMLTWARAALKRGYVVLMVDSLEQRGADTVCNGPQGGVNFVRGAKDALQAAAHLRGMPYVDGTKVALAGFSWGAAVGIAAVSRLWSETLQPGHRLDAVVAFYPKCSTVRPATGTPYELVNEDINRPLLVLMGDRDNETPPDDCISRLKPIKAAGAPVEWHVYPGATHCWDCDHLHGQRKVDAQGTSIYYSYDRKVTEDSMERMFRFFGSSFGSK
jgi:dienelactone hydrolase